MREPPILPSAVVATRLAASVAHRTWSLGTNPPAGPDAPATCHLFLLRAGSAVLTRAEMAEARISPPSLLWLPAATRGSLQIMAGSDGFSATIGAEFLQTTLGEPRLAILLRPLLDGMVLAGPDTLAARLPAAVGSFEALVEESQLLPPGALAMTGLHLGLLLMQLWRCAGPDAAAGPRGTGASTAQRFRQLVELHYREALRIDDFARRLGVTRSHLHEACLRGTGRTPMALLHERLMQEARARLEQTDLSVEQVGYGLGFRDAGYFNRFFKRLAGRSPGAYRRDATRAQAPPAAPSFAAWP